MAATQSGQPLADRFKQQWVENQSDLPGDLTVRQQAIEQLAASGLPDRKTERWRYTRLNRVFKQEFAPAVQTPAEDAGFVAAVADLSKQLCLAGLQIGRAHV